MLKVVTTSQAPAAIGPYSQAISANGMLFISGQLGLNPQTGELPHNLIDQTKQVFNNLLAILKQGNSDKSNVVKCTIYLQNMNDFAIVNELYAKFFENHKPARATVEVAKLPKNGLIEIDAIATINQTA